MEQNMADKKMMLVQEIRQENEDNRMKVRRRQQILYENNAPETTVKTKNGFLFRATVAVAVFALFLFCDISGKEIFHRTTGEILTVMKEDTLHLNEENEITERLTALLDFNH